MGANGKTLVSSKQYFVDYRQQPASPWTAETPTVHATYFDAHWYLNQNADVAAAGAEPFYHFTTYGWKEGRDIGV